MLEMIGNAVETAVARVRAWREREQARAELMSLDDRSLADIGLSRSDIPAVLSGEYQSSRTTDERSPRVAANANGKAARQVA
jgi:uncharacterized protein YjiS (DUF1127 family)